MEEFQSKEEKYIQKANNFWKLLFGGVIVGDIFTASIIIYLYLAGQINQIIMIIVVLYSILYMPIMYKFLRPMVNKRKYVFDVKKQNEELLLYILTNTLEEPRKEKEIIKISHIRIKKLNHTEYSLHNIENNYLYILNEEIKSQIDSYIS